MTKKIKLFKDFTYYSLIKEALYHSPCLMATSNDIFNYFVFRFPDLFKPSNAMTWKGNIRQVLSKNPEFVKLRKMNNSKQHFWTHKPLEIILEEESRLSACLKNTFPRDSSKINNQPEEKLREAFSGNSKNITCRKWYNIEEFFEYKKGVESSILCENALEQGNSIEKLVSASSCSIDNIESYLKDNTESFSLDIEKENLPNLTNFENRTEEKKQQYKIEPKKPFSKDPFRQLTEKNGEEIPEYFWDFNEEKLYSNKKND